MTGHVLELITSRPLSLSCHVSPPQPRNACAPMPPPLPGFAAVVPLAPSLFALAL